MSSKVPSFFQRFSEAWHRWPGPVQEGVLYLAVALMGLLWLWPCLGYEFVYDDHVDIRQVDAVFAPDGWKTLATESSARLYRPLKYLSYWLDYQWWGWNPAGWHAGNLFWHALATGLLVAWLRRLGAGYFAAALGGLVFAWHPVRIEAVAWVSSRASLMATCAVLGVLLGWHGWRNRGSWGALVSAVLSGWAGFFCKEDALMVICVLVVLEALHDSKTLNPLKWSWRLWVAEACLMVGAVAYWTLRQSILTGLSQGTWEGGFSGFLSSLPVRVVRYIASLCFPLELSVDPYVETAGGFGLAFWSASLICMALLVWVLFRKPPVASWRLGWAWAALFISPVIGLIPINQMYADRFLYLPGIALSLWVAGWWSSPKASWPRLRIGLTIAWLAWFGLRSCAYLPVWKNDLELWSHVVQVNPQSYRAYANLASLANNRGLPEDGLTLIDQALEIRPDYPEGRVIRAYALGLLERWPEAESEYRAAILSNSESLQWHLLLVTALDAQQREEEAYELCLQILDKRPNYKDALLQAVRVAWQLGRKTDAQAHFKALQVLAPSDPVVQGLGRALISEADPRP